jgi:2-polyprenyl-3-methyl-5-hydroxy-6-metoxy-1,4-benzoquinol methylase
VGAAAIAFDSGAAWRAWSSYRGSGAAVRAFLLARLAVAPLGPMDRELRALRGRVLSVGCGYAVVDRYVAEVNRDILIDGYDLDARRVAAAQATMSSSPRVNVRVGDALAAEAGGGYDAVLVIDVLHHLPADSHAKVATDLYECLRPGGTCIVKEMATTPRYQYLWNRFHDRIVAGPEPIQCRSPEEMTAIIAGAGFEIVETRRLKRLHIYPQYIVIATRPAPEAP